MNFLKKVNLNKVIEFIKIPFIELPLGITIDKICDMMYKSSIRYGVYK